MTLTINIQVVVVVVVVVIVVIGQCDMSLSTVLFLNHTISYHCSGPQVVYQYLVSTLNCHQLLKISDREIIIFMKVCILIKIKAHIPPIAVKTFKSQIINQTHY